MLLPLPNAVEKISGDKKLAYTEGFRQSVRATKGVISSARQLMRQAVADYSPPDIVLQRTNPLTLRWNKTDSRWDIIARGDKVLNPPVDIRGDQDAVCTRRGCLFKPWQWLYDRKKKLAIQLLGIGNNTWYGYHDADGFHNTLARKDFTEYFKVVYDGHEFFVKRSTASNNPGFSEFTHTRCATTTLKDTPNLRCITPLLGYQDTHESWFVSEWEKLHTEGYMPRICVGGSGYNDYGERVVARLFLKEVKEWLPEEVREDERQCQLVRDMETIIRTKLREAGLNVYDVEDNLFFHPATEQFILLDVTVKGTAPVGYTPGQ